MHPRAMLAMVRKDALDIWLDWSKFSTLLTPLFLAGIWLLISHLAGGSQPTPTTLLVYNPGQSPLPQFVSSSLSDAQITEAPSPAQVSAAFAANSAQVYDVGLIIPADFEQQLRAGGQPQVTLYLNGATLDAQQRATLQGVVLYYARSVATPRPPLNLVTQAINTGPPPASPPNLGTIYSIIMLPLSLVVGLTLLPGLVIEEKVKKNAALAAGVTRLAGRSAAGQSPGRAGLPTGALGQHCGAARRLWGLRSAAGAVYRAWRVPGVVPGAALGRALSKGERGECVEWGVDLQFSSPSRDRPAGPVYRQQSHYRLD